jgi:hypothetical protein
VVDDLARVAVSLDDGIAVLTPRIFPASPRSPST